MAAPIILGEKLHILVSKTKGVIRKRKTQKTLTQKQPTRPSGQGRIKGPVHGYILVKITVEIHVILNGARNKGILKIRNGIAYIVGVISFRPLFGKSKIHFMPCSHYVPLVCANTDFRF